MKTYIHASAWNLSGETQNILDTYQALNNDKQLMGNSTLIFGAYSFVYLHNAGAPINQKRFENMSQARNKIIHGTEIPGSKSVGNLLVSIYRHLMKSTLLWEHRLADNQPRTPFIPYYNNSLAQAILHQDNPDLQGQAAINALSPSNQGFIFDSLFIDEGTELESYINTMEDQLTTIDQLVEISSTLDGYC
ncbi:hypothetical protein [Lacticaseibacillus mingshuiensis]|uniref:hypothetical protein n=1 Tax=Lacticaseibacillus mingshuiensis TaxID=2799574 RepID=UPI0019449985|nr:hypothetical protein [Lacticaseibacillus mingshuiensis]